MYLINTPIDVNWYLFKETSPPALAELDIRIVPPKSNAIYLPGAIDVADYVPSTEFTKGFATYTFTPDKLGLWKVGLSTGTSSSSVDFYTHDIIISVNDTFTRKLVKNTLL